MMGRPGTGSSLVIVGAEAAFPALKKGTRALATSAGVWYRFSGALAIILATTAASSAGTSGRRRSRGLASPE